MRNRPNPRKIRVLVILLLVGLAYYVETQTLGITLLCPLYTFTGLRCPACGLTRACVGMLKGQWVQAATVNWGLTLSLPVLLPWLLMLLVRWLFDRPLNIKSIRVTGWVLLAWFIVWGLARNIIGV